MMRALSRPAPIRWLLVPVIGICLVLAILPWLFFGGATSGAGPRTAAEKVAATHLPALTGLSETVQRPLFHSLRQPSKAAAEGPATVSGPVVVGRYRLIGIISAGNRRQAMLARIDTGRSSLYAADDALDDWKVAAILDDGLTVTRGTETETVRLKSRAQPRP